MKSLSLAILGLFVSASTYAACPDLSGTFSCAYPDGTSDTISITQSQAAGVTTYVLNGDSLIADGVVQSLPDDGNARNQTVLYACGEDNKFTYRYTADLYENMIMAGSVVADLVLSKDAAGALVVEDVGAFSLADGSVFPWADTMSCTATR